MPIPDEKAVWDLFLKMEDPLSYRIAARMRKLGVPPDPQVVHDIAFDTCRTYLKKAVEDRDDDAPLLHLTGIAKGLTIAKYCRSRRMDSPTRIGGGGMSLEDAGSEALNKDAQDLREDLGMVIDLENSLEALKKKNLRKHHAISGLLTGKEDVQLQQELKTSRHGLNYLISSARSFISKRINGATGKEKKS